MGRAGACGHLGPWTQAYGGADSVCVALGQRCQSRDMEDGPERCLSEELKISHFLAEKFVSLGDL